jgi:hypothetical protein
VERVASNPDIPPDAGGAVAALGVVQAKRKVGYPKGLKRTGVRGKSIPSDVSGVPASSVAPGTESARSKPDSHKSKEAYAAENESLRARLALQVLPDDVRYRQAERAIEGCCAAGEFVAFLAGVPDAAPDAEQVKALKESGAPAIAPYMERLGVWGPWLPFLAVLVTIFITNWKRVSAAQAKTKQLTNGAPSASPESLDAAPLPA